MKPLLLKMMLFAAYLLLPAMMSGQSAEIKYSYDIAGQHHLAATAKDLLYDQLSEPSAEGAIASQEFPDVPGYTCEASDDFVVPGGATWDIEEIHVYGGYSPDGGPVQIANLRIYENDPVMEQPGALLYEFLDFPVTEDNGNLIFNLTSPLTDYGISLGEGHYWVSAQPKMEATDFGQWYWAKKKLPTQFNEFHWRNPGGGFGIPGAENWTASSALNPDTGDHNLMFGIYGNTSGQEEPLYSVNDVYTNPDIQEGDLIIVGGYYTNPEVQLLLQNYSDWPRDQVFPPQSYLVIEGTQPPVNAENGGYVIVQGTISFVDNPDPVHPEDAQTAHLNALSIVVIFDGFPPDGNNDQIKKEENWNIIPDNLRDCDSCKFAILISGGANARNNHSKYWENLVALYNFKVNHQNYCPDNIIVHYYQGTRRDDRIPESNVKKAHKDSISASFDDISSRIAKCNDDDKPATFQKMVTNHGAENGDINLLGNNVLSPEELKNMEQKIIDSCCRTMYDEFLQCYGGHSVDAMSSLDNKNKTTIYANSNADQSYGYSPHGQVHHYLAAKIASLTDNNAYPDAVVSAKMAYDNYLQGLVNNAHAGANAWRNTEPGFYIVEGSVVYLNQAYINNQIDLWVADSTEIASNICKSRNVTVVPMKEYCEWKKFVVPPGGQLVLDFEGDPDNCGNVSIYKGSKNNKIGVWNWNLPGSWGYTNGNNQRVINGDEDQPTTFWIHNDNGEYTITSSSNGNQNLNESVYNVGEYPGFSNGGNDSSPNEFGVIISPTYFYENIDQIPMTTFDLPGYMGSEFVQEFGFTFNIDPDNPYWSEMELYLNIHEVLAPGILEIMAENSSVGFTQIEITTPGVYTIPVGAMGGFGPFGSMMMIVPVSSNLAFSFDSWGLRTQYQEPVLPEPFDGFLAIGDYVNPEPWNNWIGSSDDFTHVQMFQTSGNVTVNQVEFAVKTEDLTWTTFYVDDDGSQTALNTIGPVTPEGDGWSGYLPHDLLPPVEQEVFVLATATLEDGTVHEISNSIFCDPTPPDGVILNLSDWIIIDDETIMLEIDPGTCTDLLQIEVSVAEKEEEFNKGIPDVWQFPYDYGCAPASAAGCLKWFESQGDTVIAGGLSEWELLDSLYARMNTDQRVNKDGDTIDGTLPRDVVSGLRSWIAENGNGYRVTNVLPYDWKQMRDELERGQNVLTGVRYPNGGGHLMTFNSIKNRPEEDGRIRVDFMDPFSGKEEYGYLDTVTGVISDYSYPTFESATVFMNVIVCPKETSASMPSPSTVIPGPVPAPTPIDMGEPGLKWLRIRVIDESGNVWQENLVVERTGVIPQIDQVFESPMQYSQSIRIQGSNFGEFGPDAGVAFNGVLYNSEITFWSPEAVYFSCPDLEPGDYSMQVQHAGGVPSNEVMVTVAPPGEVLFILPNDNEHIKGGPVKIQVTPPIHRSLIDSVRFFVLPEGTADRIYVGSDTDGAMTKAGTYVPIGEGDGWSLDFVPPDSFFDIFVTLEAEAHGKNGQVYTGTREIFWDPDPVLININRDNSRLTGGFGIPEDGIEIEFEVDEEQMEELLQLFLQPLGGFDFIRPLEHIDQDDIEVTAPNGDQLTETCGPTAAAVCLDWLNKNAGGDGYASIPDSVRRIARLAGTDAGGTWDDQLERAINDMLDRDPNIGETTVSRHVHDPDNPRDHYNQIAGNLRDSADVIILLNQKLENGETVGHYVTVSSHHTELSHEPPPPNSSIVTGIWVEKHYIDFMDPATGETVYMPVNWTNNPPTLDESYEIGEQETDGEAWIEGVIVVKENESEKTVSNGRFNPVWNYNLPLTGAGTYNITIPTAQIPPGLYMFHLIGNTINGVPITENLITISAPYQPLANFATSDTTGLAPFTIQFTDLSIPADSIVSWHWEFGDGGESTQQDPVYTYYNTGVYNVTLTVSDGTEFYSITREEIIEVFPGLDFGDAPDDPGLGFNYNTLLATNGARHVVVPGVYMGNQIDAEPDGQPTINADGDDLNNLNDEDGVEFIGNVAVGKAATVRVKTSVDGILNAWLDFDKNGTWVELNNQIFTNTPLSTGWNTLNFTVPANTEAGWTYSRFRFNTTGGLNYDGQAQDGEVEDYKIAVYPEYWSYMPTDISHTILIPLSLEETKLTFAEDITLQPEDLLGVFYNDNGIIICGGAIVWEGGNNQTLTAFGNDQTTPEKDGFNEGEPFAFRLFRPSTGEEFDLSVEFDQSFPDSDGLFHANGLSSLLSISPASITQEIPIPEGWSGISTWIEPDNPDINDMFSQVMNQLIVLYNLDGIFWPGINLNTITDWDPYSGYAIKTSADVMLEVSGQELSDQTVLLNTGWNLMPVLTPEIISISSLFENADDFIIAKKVAGLGIYWPAYSINTIGNLIPGEAYWINTTSPVLVDFNPSGIILKAGEDFEMPEIVSPWGNMNRTPSSHLVLFNAENSPLMQGDVIGGFTPEGIFAGAWPVSDPDAPLALTLFGNDPAGFEQSGFTAGEPLSFKVYRSGTEEIFDLEVTYNPMMNTGQFEAHGLSEVTAMKLSATGLSSLPVERLSIFPNPTPGVFTITGVEGEVMISIFNAFGNEVKQLTSTLPTGIDLSGHPKGVYFVKIETTEGVHFEKLIRN